MLIRLERKGDEIKPILIDQETLAVITRDRIEIR